MWSAPRSRPRPRQQRERLLPRQGAGGMRDSQGQGRRTSSLLFLSLVWEDLMFPASQRAKPFPTWAAKKPQGGVHLGHPSGACLFCPTSPWEGGPQGCC